MHSAVVLFALLTSQRAAASFYQCSVPIADTSKCSDTILDAAIAPGFCAVQFRDNIMMPRGLEVTPEGDVLVLERVSKDLSSAKIVKLYDTDGDNVAESKIDLVSMQGLNHGLAYRNGHIYASSSATVFRWPFTPASLEPITTSAEIVVHSMNADGQGGAPLGHTTRTLAFDASGRLYISIGSAGNVDSDSFRSRIRRFSIDNLPSGGISFADGEVFADGLRNEVGLAFDRFGVLWGVENGADSLVRNDLGGDIHNDNPAEELNRFPEEKSGSHWGYPYCWSEFSLQSDAGLGAGSVWAWPSFKDDGTHDDGWCRANTQPSVMAMQAHSAPLGITFFNVSSPFKPPHSSIECSGGFPAHMLGDAFVGFHGSWNRDTPTGYKVVHIPMTSRGLPCFPLPNDFLCHAGGTAKWPSGSRPVDVRFDSCGRLLVTDDGANQVLMIRYTGSLSSTEASSGSCLGATPPPVAAPSSSETSSGATSTPAPAVFSAALSMSTPSDVWVVGPTRFLFNTPAPTGPRETPASTQYPANAGLPEIDIRTLSITFHVLSAVASLAAALYISSV